jgi:hypothetical protein
VKILDLLKSTLVMLPVALPAIALATTHSNKAVGQIQVTHAAEDCFWFSLEGVTEADPVTAGNPWFAIPRTQYGARDAYAALLAAKLSGQTVTVTTNGSVSCGYATAYVVTIQ